MAEKFSFFDSVGADRVYYAADWALHLSKYFTNGIFNNGLQVSANNDMSVSIASGDANINGYRYTNDAEKIITVSNADGVLNRIDNIVVRLDLVNRQITTEIITGSFAEKAIAPALVRGTSIFDIRIAKIKVPAGTTEITEDLIEDTRFNDDDCGNVICAVQNPDFTSILKQYEALWNALIDGKMEIFESWFKERTENFNKWFEEKTQNFDTWFEDIKNKLSEDIAGSLQLQINKMKEVLKEAIAPITTENGEYLATESGELIIMGM